MSFCMDIQKFKGVPGLGGSWTPPPWQCHGIFMITTSATDWCWGRVRTMQ